MIEPLHIASIGGHSLRFFRSPLDDGRPDFPWHAIDDLHRALGLDRRARRFFLAKLRSAHGELRTVATADGLVTVAPHFMAQGTVDAMVDEGMAPASARSEYDRAGAAAMKKLARDLGLEFPTDTWLAWMKAAMDRWDSSTAAF
jgi:hypothetical protein